MHKPVLLHEVIEGLNLQKNDVLIDGTLGRAGHSLEAVKKEKNIFIIGIDRDQEAIEQSSEKLSQVGADFKLFKGNFKDMDLFLKETRFDHANKIILDLGISSPHLDSSGRGFSFKNNEPLLMTMEKDPRSDSFTAKDILNDWQEEDIANVIYAYGEERYAKRIAKAVVLVRENKKIETTGDFVSIIEGAVPGSYRRGKIHPATKSFQALRIAVNDELGSLKNGLNIGLNALKPEGRMAVISFHSLEDRIVKRAMKEWEKEGKGKSLTKRPVTPSEKELIDNPRSRSAKLRIFIKN